MCMKCISMAVLFEIPMFLQWETSTIHLENNMIVTKSYQIEKKDSIQFSVVVFIQILNNYFKSKNEFCKYIGF